MTTYIFNSAGACIGQSHNLRGMLERARGDGVTAIEVTQLNDGPGRPGAFVVARYRSGNYAQTYFACGSHAVDWATERSHSSARRSWFAGCKIITRSVPTGEWSYKLNPG